MEIIKNKNGEELTIDVVGRLDTTTAPMLENEINLIGDEKSLVINFEKLEYISSAGLRVILAAQKKMAKQGKMVIRNVNDDVMEVLDMTGFSDILTIE